MTALTAPIRWLQYKALVLATAARYGYDAALLAAQIHQESAWKPDAVSPCGAQGLAQFMPATWKDYGKGASPFEPAPALDACVRLMRDNLKRYAGDTRLALAAYNCGPGNVNKAAKKAGSFAWDALERYLPAETRAYVPAILSKKPLYSAIAGALQVATQTAPALLLVVVLGAALLVRRLTA